jgi:hypothetical protein
MTTKLKLKPRKPQPPKEWHEQRRVFDWAKEMTPREPRLELLNGSMNGLRSTPAAIWMAKMCGLKPGVPDINLPVIGYAGCPGYYIEQKRMHVGKINGWECCATDEQKWWRDHLREQGYKVDISHNAERTIALLKAYLDMEE